MQDFEKTREQLLQEIAELRLRLQEPEETLEAIRRGAVDAFVVQEPEGEAVYTLETAAQALQLLVHAGELLSQSLDPATILDTADRLAVPALADRCTLDLAEERPDGPPDGPPNSSPNSPPDSPTDAIHGGPRGVDHARIVERPGASSAMVVPLVARGRTLGAWTFVFAESGRRHREADLQVAQELAGRVAVTLDNARLYREVVAGSRAKDHFLATLSHELRTPLAPALAMVERLQAGGDLPAEARAGLDLIRRNIELEARLIDDLLDLTRITCGKLELRSRPLDLRQVIRQALETCGEHELAPHRVTLDLAAGDHGVRGDPTRLTQVFWNLLSNALKFTPAGGAVGVRTYLDSSATCGVAAREAAGACLAVEVADSGVGIEAEALPHIFDAFDQGRAGTTRRFGGLGLGLAISRAIVEQHGGTLKVASGGQDQGAVFTVRLPLASVAAGVDPAAGSGAAAGAVSVAPVRPAAPVASAPVGATGERPTVAGGALHILLVEDHLDTAQAMSELLASMGHRVTVTGTIAASLAAAARGDVDLVLSDLGLPDGQGSELMRILAARHHLRGIALSGYGMEDDIARSREAGFALHITKPVSLETLRTAIQQIAGRAPAEPDPVAPP
jgi:signal transduction histidine kinase/ActR/RegA family two-component response regulator